MQLTLSYLIPILSLTARLVMIIINQDPVQANRKLQLERGI